MNQTEIAYHSIANPRRTTLVGRSAAEAAAPHAGTDEEHGLQMLGSTLRQAQDGAGGVCADGSCALPE
ncbi:hypothetical protein GCM10009809_15810 [Isoptericola hypogeus]|uniref:Uncharacterized protein n=1 Tax=Isoptericola hypogeus TaxID=300179 RepID=A0ABN2J9Z3_9MICO